MCKGQTSTLVLFFVFVFCCCCCCFCFEIRSLSGQQVPRIHLSPLPQELGLQGPATTSGFLYSQICFTKLSHPSSVAVILAVLHPTSDLYSTLCVAKATGGPEYQLSSSSRQQNHNLECRPLSQPLLQLSVIIWPCLVLNGMSVVSLYSSFSICGWDTDILTKPSWLNLYLIRWGNGIGI